MNRPYIFCHMMTSLDGKIMGSYMDIPEGKKAQDVFYNIAFGNNPFYRHQGWLSGRITTDDNFTHYKKPALDEITPIVPDGDFIINQQASIYYVSIDPSGKLGWESNQLRWRDTTANIIEVITQKTSDAYKAFLRKLNIPYIICGTDTLNYASVLEKLKTLFGIEMLMLGGGGVLNWSFIQAGMCDELSVLIAPSADGSSQTPSLFEARESYAIDKPVSFTLKKIEVMEGDCVWLRYQVNNAITSN